MTILTDHVRLVRADIADLRTRHAAAALAVDDRMKTVTGIVLGARRTPVVDIDIDRVLREMEAARDKQREVIELKRRIEQLESELPPECR